MEVRFLGNYLGHGYNFGGATFDADGISPTILSRDWKGAKAIIDIRKVDIVNEQNTMPSRAEQSRAEQSRAEQLNGCIRLGNIYNDEKYTGGDFGENVWDINGLSPTMKTGASASQQCVVEVKKMEKINVLGGLTENSSQRNVVYNSDGLSPTIQAAAGTGGGKMPYTVETRRICAMRGRDKDNPNHRGPANENYEQVLEINNSGISNTLTSVTKDNLVLETKYYGVDEQNQCIRKETFGTLTTDGSSPKLEQDLIVDDLYENREKRVYENVSPTLRGERNGLKTIKIRQATKEGFIDCEIPGVADLDYPNSNTRRGRVQRGGADKSYSDNGEYP